MSSIDHHFDALTILLHWLMAFIIFGLFGLGLYMVELNYYDSWYRGSTALHKNIGVSLFLLLLVRVFWRLRSTLFLAGNERVSKKTTIEDKLASFVHLLMYVLIACICLSGYLIATAGERGIDFFSMFLIPHLPIQLENQEDLAGIWHFYLAWFLIITVLCHVLAALKHHFIDKDRTLINMLRPSKIKKEDS